MAKILRYTESQSTYSHNHFEASSTEEDEIKKQLVKNAISTAENI
jgi:hypothetical protein